MKLQLLIFLPIFCYFSQASEPQPNFIIIFTDDQGYQDVGCYGSPDIKTPHLDQMANEGAKFTSFYAQTVCGPSRAALMTGSYPLRTKWLNEDNNPHPELASSEVTIAEVLKPLGYTNYMVGKWDLAGHSQTTFKMELSPENQGFDHSLWTPASNDSSVNLYESSQLVKKNAPMPCLTKTYTDKAISYIKNHDHDTPFFLYLAHTMPHTKLGASNKFKGKSKGGLYGDVIEEIDYNTGRILSELDHLNLSDHTYVIFTSDNGPWWVKKQHGGHCEPLRGAKTSCFEGGVRVPCIIKAPGKIKPGSTHDAVCATIDLLPTIAEIAGTTPPSDRTIDGISLASLWHGETATTERSYYYYQDSSLRAVRVGDWKLHQPHSKKDMSGWTPKWMKHVAPNDRVIFKEYALYNLKTDIEESSNVAKEHPEVVEKLMQELDFAKQDIGYNDIIGANSRR